MTNITILNDTQGLCMYYTTGPGWKDITTGTTGPITVSDFIEIISTSGSFAIGFDMNCSSTNVVVTANYWVLSPNDQKQYTWRLSNITGENLHVTIKNELNIGAET